MLEAFGLSDPGCVRTNNEDYFISDCEAGLFIVADGMGGANAGEYASRLSADTLYFCLRNRDRPFNGPTLESAFLQANQAVRQAADSMKQLQGMGTTLLVARTRPNGQVEIGAVGDSRAYLASQGEFSQITQDQTWVAEVGPRLGLDEEALRRHPMRHVLTMAVGATDDLRIQCYSVQMNSGDLLLLCSDGLHGVVGESTLADTMISTKNLPDKCHYLIEAAKSEGGPDNITVVLVHMA